MKLKQVILVRNDLKLSKGKMSVQTAHASVEAATKSSSETINKWRASGAKKVVLKVENLDELLKYKRQAEDAKLKTALITDAAHTFFKEPTTTCLAIGPDDEDKIDEITGKLKLID